MSISVAVFLKFLIVWGFIFWFTRRQSRQLKAAVDEAKAREAQQAVAVARAAAAPAERPAQR